MNNLEWKRVEKPPIAVMLENILNLTKDHIKKEVEDIERTINTLDKLGAVKNTEPYVQKFKELREKL